MTVTLKPQTEITVPKSIRRKAGYRPGDQVEFKVSGRTITIVPKLSTPDDEYTPGQRRIIDARLAKAEEDIKAGRVHGPFTAKEAAVFVERLAKERAAKKTTRARR
jgi:AbrB family looped-hinge helix DNA binding protein